MKNPVWPLLALLTGLLGVHLAGQARTTPPSAPEGLPSETVYFPSADGSVELVGYVFRPSGAGAHPAVVMLHGRAGPYSTAVNAGCERVARDQRSPCDARALSRRHLQWGRIWADRGYVALLVDSFGPRGKGHGFGRRTHDDPARESVNERTVRPLDAIAGLRYLRTRPDVAGDRVALQGWSNGGSTVLNVVADTPAMQQAFGATAPFNAAAAFYPGCGTSAVDLRKYRSTTPLIVLLGDADEEVSPEVCAKLLAGAATGPNVLVKRYPGASHDFDDPGRQRDAANAAAYGDARAEVQRLFSSVLER